MKEKIKKVWAEHKKEIIIGAVIVGGVATVLITKKATITGGMEKMKGWKYIAWEPQPEKGFMTLERAKEILDLNANNAAKFAIFREGPNPAEYVCIMLDKDLTLA